MDKIQIVHLLMLGILFGFLWLWRQRCLRAESEVKSLQGTVEDLRKQVVKSCQAAHDADLERYRTISSYGVLISNNKTFRVGDKVRALRKAPLYEYLVPPVMRNAAFVGTLEYRKDLGRMVLKDTYPIYDEEGRNPPTFRTVTFYLEPTDLLEHEE